MNCPVMSYEKSMVLSDFGKPVYYLSDFGKPVY